MKAVFNKFLSLYEDKKVVVLGDMGELGENAEKYHKNAGKLLNRFDNVQVVTIGQLAKYIAETCEHPTVCFNENKEAAKYIVEHIPKDTTILFKASRAMKFEEIISEIEELEKQ